MEPGSIEELEQRAIVAQIRQVDLILSPDVVLALVKCIRGETGNPMTEQNQRVGHMNKSILRFACGARLPRNDFLSKPWSEQNHTRPPDSKGRWAVTVWDQAGGIDKPIMPDGSSAQCATDCPKKRVGGRKEHKYIGRHIGANTKWDRGDLRLCITCNPTEEKA